MLFFLNLDIFFENLRGHAALNNVILLYTIVYYSFYLYLAFS
jgi:hypothetical protein